MNIFGTCFPQEHSNDTFLRLKMPYKASMYNMRQLFKIQNGFVQSIEKKGQSKTQFLILIPHTFLYIFDKDNKESPKDIINLTFYNKFEKDKENPKQFILKSETYNNLPVLKFGVDYEEDVTHWENNITNALYSKLCCVQRNYKRIMFVNSVLLELCLNYMDNNIRKKLSPLVNLQMEEINAINNNISPSKDFIETVKNYEKGITESIEKSIQVTENDMQREKDDLYEKEIQKNKQRMKLETENREFMQEIESLKKEKKILVKELKKTYEEINHQKNIIKNLARYIKNS